MSPRVLVVERRIAGPPARVFERFTARVDTWWQHGPRFRTWPGSTMSFSPSHLLERQGYTVVVRATVTRWSPPDALHLLLDGAPVEVDFQPDGDHTRLRIRHHRPADGRTAFADPMGVWWAQLLARVG